MFKNATITGFNKKATLDFSLLPAFSPPGSVDPQSYGFSGDPLTYGKHTLLQFTLEKKHIPSSAINVLLEEHVEKLTQEHGFAPGKKLRKELKERVIDELLPRALSVRRTTAVWIDAEAGRVVVDSSSKSLADMINRELIRAFPEIGLQDVSWPRSQVLTAMLGEAPAGFTNDDQVVMQWPGENGKVVRYAGAQLDDADVQGNLELGAEVVSLAVTYGSRISCILTGDMQLRRLKLTDVVETPAKDADQALNNFVLTTAELSSLITAIESLK